VVTKEDAADLDVEVIIRGLTVPKFVIGIGARPGDPPGGNAPLKVAVLRVRLTRGEVATDFTNKNKPGDTPRGWKSAADDIVDQIEKWIRAGAPRDGGTRHRLRPSRSSTATP
jgi:hypothetical protein